MPLSDTIKNKMYKDIIHFLNERRLKEGLTQLKAFADKANSWSISSTVENLQTNYEFMLNYAATGQEDPERGKLYLKLLRKAYELADRIQFENKMSEGFGDLADKFRTYKLRPAKSFQELTEELIALNAADGFNTPDEQGNFCDHDLYKPHTTFDDELFYKTVTSTHWSNAEYDEAYELLSKGMSTFDIAIWISAITLSLLQYYDSYKFYFLLNVYLNKHYPVIKSRTLVGIALTIFYHEDRMKLYPENKTIFDFTLDQKDFDRDIYQIQLLFLLSRETEKIDKKMREEIIPQMLKNPYLKNPEMKIQEIEFSELEEKNPEWQKDIDNITKHLHELGELQREGADTYMSTFALLKHYPFFRNTAHWFYPFSQNVPSVAKIFHEKNIKEKSILYMMLNSPAFCNSDKYSFCMALDEIPASQMQMMGEEVQDKEDILNEQLGASSNTTEDENNKIVIRQYIQDLYRFCKLWNFRKQQHDIFTDSLTLWKSKALSSHLLHSVYTKNIADYLLSKGYYQEAAEVYEQLNAEDPSNVEILQKVGFAYQKLKDYKEAISYYNMANLFKTRDPWTLKHMAQCFKRLNDYRQALDCFKQVAELEPDNLNLISQIGQCQATIGEYDEALKSFFKVEYLGKTPENARRSIAWCYFMTGKYEEAIRFYEKITQQAEPSVNDWLNFGHVYLAQGMMKEAVACYQHTAEGCETHSDFIEVFSRDKKVLKEKGIDEVTLQIIQDLV